MMMRMIFLAPSLIALGACGGGGSNGGPTAPANPSNPGGPGASSATVEMRSVGDGYGGFASSFVPGAVNIIRGGTVSWTNASGDVHNVTFAAASGAPANIPDHQSGTNQRAFSAAGSFIYSCTNHPGMGGQVTVQ